mmetsp:Transcript_107605/g.304353  ORF Transcript_107605/g.304353 Transcript_107605/m.304353 type:complete len:381 (-) Transcript_107605:198-1340(-)
MHAFRLLLPALSVAYAADFDLKHDVYEMDANSSGKCRDGFEFSLKLSLPVFKHLPPAIDGLMRDLQRATQRFPWFRDPVYHRGRGVLQIVRFLDTPNMTFAAKGILVRFRRIIAGENIGLTDMVLKDQSEKFSNTKEMPVSPARWWKRYARCKTEANVFAHGPVDWQHDAKLRSKTDSGTFTQTFPDHPQYLGNISMLFPWVSQYLGLEGVPDRDAIPLHAVHTQFRRLEFFDMNILTGDPPRHSEKLPTTLTLEYSSREDMEVFSAQPIDADFEWKTKEGTESWRDNSHSDELLRWLTATSNYTNHSYSISPPQSLLVKSRYAQSPLMLPMCVILSSMAVVATLSALAHRLAGELDEHDVYIKVDEASEASDASRASQA